jgi:outer membrane lipoprotein-sorting protein
MRRPAVIRAWFLGAALAGGLGCAAPAHAQDATQILARSLTPDRPTFVGEQVTEISGMQRPKIAEMRGQRQMVYRKGPILRINYPNGQVMFDDERTMVLYLPRQNVLERTESPRSPENILKQRRAILRGRGLVTQLPDDTVAGREAWVVATRPPNGASRKVWVDKQTYVQLRQDVTQPNGKTLSTYFTRIDYTAEPPAAMLTFTPPPGALLAERGHGRPVPTPEAGRMARAWGGLLEARNLPAGFRLRGFYRHQFKGRPALVALYDGPGNKTLSLFQGPAMGMSGMAEDKQKFRFVTARKGNADVMVMGPLTQEELQRVMDSVE